MIRSILRRVKRVFYREPDFVIGEPDNLYLRRWWVIPRNRFFNVYLHHFMRSDDDRALHDHPWWNVSILLKGSYVEVVPDPSCAWMDPTKQWTIQKVRYPFIPVFRRAEAAHRVALRRNGKDAPEKPVWSLFITGPRAREWGFWCPKGWRHWKEFVSVRPGGNATGKGCEE